MHSWALTSRTGHMARSKRSSRARRKASSIVQNANPTDSDALAIQKAILRRLNGLIFLIAESLPQPVPANADLSGAKRGRKKKPLGKQEQLTLRLSQGGLRPIEIAELTRRHANNVSRDLSKARKAGRIP